jgi:hypothetical protein
MRAMQTQRANLMSLQREAMQLRGRALQCRQLAAGDLPSSISAELLMLARRYERAAERIEAALDAANSDLPVA